ncbi:unnamed protein product [Candida verbasci]|uniref:Cell wall mannoprotein PIR1-like C-terminal domain-containing protein n=1 Tax=Candida verbasci TaxID=1227364 RepID=A0A9W4TW88_9ASCO|nr:unnamed protein product [Candida verbasci]
MRFSFALLSLAATSLVSAGYFKPTPIDEDCYETGLTSVDFEFALGVKDCDYDYDYDKRVYDLVFEIGDGQLEHDGCHLITCESCYPTSTYCPTTTYCPDPVTEDCETTTTYCPDDCDDKHKHKWKRGEYYSKKDKYCEVCKPFKDVTFFTLCDTVFQDECDGIGSIVANHQFQVDKPVQVDAIYTKGFTIVEKDDEYLLALKGKTKFWHCKVDDCGLYKLYDKKIAPQCSEIELVIIKAKKCDEDCDDY